MWEGPDLHLNKRVAVSVLSAMGTAKLVVVVEANEVRGWARRGWSGHGETGRLTQSWRILTSQYKIVTLISHYTIREDYYSNAVVIWERDRRKTCIPVYRRGRTVGKEHRTE